MTVVDADAALVSARDAVATLLSPPIEVFALVGSFVFADSRIDAASPAAVAVPAADSGAGGFGVTSETALVGAVPLSIRG